MKMTKKERNNGGKQAKKNSNINFNITFLSHRTAMATAILYACIRSFYRNLQSVLILFQTSREIMHEC